MTTVIAFQDWPKPARSSEARPSGSAQVIIFPGVQIERLDDEVSEKRPRSNRLPSLSNQAIAEDLR